MTEKLSVYFFTFCCVVLDNYETWGRIISHLDRPNDEITKMGIYSAYLLVGNDFSYSLPVCIAEMKKKVRKLPGTFYATSVAPVFPFSIFLYP